MFSPLLQLLRRRILNVQSLQKITQGKTERLGLFLPAGHGIIRIQGQHLFLLHLGKQKCRIVGIRQAVMLLSLAACGGGAETAETNTEKAEESENNSAEENKEPD